MYEKYYVKGMKLFGVLKYGNPVLDSSMIKFDDIKLHEKD